MVGLGGLLVGCAGGLGLGVALSLLEIERVIRVGDTRAHGGGEGCEKERERESKEEGGSNEIERAERARVLDWRATSTSVRQQCSFFGELVGCRKAQEFSVVDVSTTGARSVAREVNRVNFGSTGIFRVRQGGYSSRLGKQHKMVSLMCGNQAK